MSEKEQSKHKVVMVLTLITMGIAMISIAWCSYQSNQWNGVQTFKLREVGSDSIQAAEKNLQQGQETIFDVIRFTHYSEAVLKNDTKLSDFYYERFRPDMKAAVDAWLKTDPFTNPNAPPHPFNMKEYNKTYALEAQQFSQKMQSDLQEANNANNISSNYVLMTVIFSMSLFITGIIEKTGKFRLRLILLGMSIITTSLAIAVVLLFPIAWNSSTA